MLISFLKFALRSLRANGLFSLIKITGLTVGLAACLVIGLYVRHELSYDTFHEKADRIARVTMEYHVNGETVRAAVTGTKVAPSLARDFPEVERAVRVYKRPRVVQYADQTAREVEDFYFADSTFFEIFSFELQSGDSRSVLDQPYQIVVTASVAREYFGDDEPVGKVLRVENDQEYTISGVMADPPLHSQIQPAVIASFHSLSVARPENETWWSANYATYLLLREGEAIPRLEAKIPAYMRERSDETRMTGENYLRFGIEPLRNVHLRSDLPGNFEPSGDIRYVYILGMVGVLILLIGASIYINLSIAASTRRARQVGVQKVLGATPALLFRQHLAESLVVSFAALFLSLPLAAMLLPIVNELFDRTLSVSSVFEPLVISALIVFGVGVGVLSGAYPALVLARFKPSSVLKGNFALSSSGVWLRKSLIVFQFFISVGLIICTLVLQEQLEFIQDKKLGYDKDHVLVIRMDRQTVDRIDALKSEFLNSAGVQSVSLAYETPTHIEGGYGIAPSPSGEGRKPVTALPADEHFLETFNIELVAGRGLTSSDVELAQRINERQDTTSALPIIINESQARAFGLEAEEAVGRLVQFQGTAEIKGVAADFHFASLHEPIGNLVIFPSGWGNSLMVKLAGDNITAALASLEESWARVVTHRPFDYHFLDDEFDQMYGSELQTARVAQAFSAVAIILACLGLFGLASYSIVQRTKEIGVRKVLGASVSSLVAVLSADFLKLVVIAFVAAAPIAYLVMQRWLEDFAYRTDMSWWIFAGAGLAAVAIALLTVSYQAIKSAVSDPVKSLRYE